MSKSSEIGAWLLTKILQIAVFVIPIIYLLIIFPAMFLASQSRRAIHKLQAKRND